MNISDNFEDIKGRATEMVVKAFSPHRPAPGQADDPRLDPRFHGNIVRPRFIPGVWMRYLEISTRLKAAIEEVATASVGIGIRGIPDPLELEFAGPGGLGKIATNRQLAAARSLTLFARNPKFGSFLPLSWELSKAQVDFLGSGNGYLEVVEENHEAGGPIVGLGHVRTAMMRINPERTRWVQALHSDTYHSAGQTTIQYGGRYYRVFGDDDPARRFIDRLTGVFYSTWPSSLPESRKGNSIIHACSYNPLDPYYGMPVQVPALQAIIEDDMTAKFMCAFVDKGTQVPILIIVEKGQLTPASSEKVEALFNSDSKGLDNGGRAAIIQPAISGVAGANTTIRVERVELGVKDLQPLFDRKASNGAEILESVRMSGVFIGGGEGGGGTVRNASVVKQLSFEHAIEPHTAFWEAILNNGVAPRIAPGGAFRITRPKNLDPVQVAAVLKKMESGLSMNDAREATRSLINGIDLPVLNLGPDGDLPMPLLKAKLDQDLARLNQPIVPANVQDENSNVG